MQHDRPLTLPWLDETKAAWRTIAAFVAERCVTRGLAGPLARSRESRDLVTSEHADNCA